jgi:LysM repeat protein
LTARPGRLVLMTIVIAVAAGALVGGVSQITAVSLADPRPSVPPVATPTPIPTAEPTPSPTSTPVPSATPTPDPLSRVWLYTVIEGDSLSRIAIRFGTTTDTILALNPAYADNQNLVQEGAEMILPCTPISASEDRC